MRGLDGRVPAQLAPPRACIISLHEVAWRSKRAFSAQEYFAIVRLLFHEYEI